MSNTRDSKASSNDDLDDEFLEFDVGDYTPRPASPDLHPINRASLSSKDPDIQEGPQDLGTDEATILHSPKNTADADPNNTLTPSAQTPPTLASPMNSDSSTTLRQTQLSPSPKEAQPAISNDSHLETPSAQPDSNDIASSPRQEHLNRIRRKAELEKTGEKKSDSAPLGSVGFNHNKSSSISSIKQEPGHLRGLSSGSFGLAGEEKVSEEKEAPFLSEEEDWQHMPTVASYEVYNEKGDKVVVKQDDFETERQKDDKVDEETGGSKYGYTRVTLDEDVKSVTSMDENTDFLFDEDEFKRNPLSQLENTKDMLTEGQRIAYVGLCKLAMIELATELATLRGSRKIAKQLSTAQGSFAKWAQMMMMRLYSHMDISVEGKFSFGITAFLTI